MTTSKPEVVAIKDSDVGGLIELKPVSRLPHGARLIRLSDYEALQAECEKLRKAIRRLCNIYLVDDYYSGDLREELLDRAVERSIDKAMQEGS